MQVLIRRSDYLAVNLHDYDIRYEALQEGAQQKAVEAAINLLKMNKLSPEEIAQVQALPLKQVLELQKTITVKA